MELCYTYVVLWSMMMRFLKSEKTCRRQVREPRGAFSAVHRNCVDGQQSSSTSYLAVKCGQAPARRCRRGTQVARTSLAVHRNFVCFCSTGNRPSHKRRPASKFESLCDEERGGASRTLDPVLVEQPDSSACHRSHTYQSPSLCRMNFLHHFFSSVYSGHNGAHTST